MIVYVIVLTLVLIILLQRASSKMDEKLSKLDADQEYIKRQLDQIQKQLTETPSPTYIVAEQPIIKQSIRPEPQKIVEVPIMKVDEEKPVPPVTVELPVIEPVVEKENPVTANEEIRPEETEPVRPIYTGQLYETGKIEKPVTEPKVVLEGKSTLGNLMDRAGRGDIDYEKYIGENLISKIGIAILVLAIGFFVKYAIDNDWIGPVGRVCIGLLCGGILVGLAHRLRKDYVAFTSVLVGGGLAIFYFTIALAYHQYHLFDHMVAFGIMVVITIFAVVLSLLYDRQELAVISMVGGYATPFMVSNGSGNYIALLSYLCILNTGLLVIAYMRSWRILNALAFVFTFVIYDSWLFTLNDPVTASTYSNGLIFGSVFFLFFFIAAIANNIRENKKFLPIDFGMLLINSIQFFGVGLYLLELMKAHEYRGLFSACLAAFHLIASYLLFRRQNADKNILYLLIGITLTCISITAPLQLEGNFITLFWASEAVLLLWLYQKSRIRIISLGSTLVWCITVVSLAVVFGNNYGMTYNVAKLNIIFNKAFISAIYVGLSTGAMFLLSRRNQSPSSEEAQPAIVFPPVVFLAGAIAILFIAGACEIVYQFENRFEISLSAMYFVLYLLIFAVVFLAIIRRFELIKMNPMIELTIASALIGVYMIHLPMLFDTYRDMLTQHKYIPYFSAHWISAVIIVGLIRMLINKLRKVENIESTYSILTWSIGTLVIVFLSAEVYFAIFGFFFSGPPSEESINNIFIKACLPILWGLCSFAFMWIGMRESFRQLRILSLVLFSITLVKLFSYDISNVPVAGKIAAFFCLGVLLLVVSFMYQRLKKLIIQDAEHKEN